MFKCVEKSPICKRWWQIFVIAEQQVWLKLVNETSYWQDTVVSKYQFCGEWVDKKN